MTEVAAYRIAIAGVVQGVGFRPFVYNLAQRLGVRGWVRNHSGGVAIEAEAAPEILEAFTRALRDEAPPLAYIASLTWESIPLNGYAAFEIRQSERQPGQYQLISPDVATCPDCLRELLDPQDRRCRYPFINCTNCGPRFTIINDIPYDRPNTTMGVFPLCDDCAAEYRNPGDRRFHAQPNACPVCGPHIWWVESAPLQTASEDELRALATRAPTVHPGQEETEAVLAQARDWLLEGKILAIKGLGGFHLACDATNPQAVEELRRRKRRPYKPFAVMVPTLDDARRQCVVAPEAERAFSSPQCPIVLLDRRPDSTIAENVAPRNHTLGLMMPYTPLHHILLRDVGRPLVMTSGNVTEEPIARDNDEALRRLAGLADAFVLHNRDIYARYDDAVVQVIPPATPTPGAPDDGPGVLIQPVRRARGYAPFPIRLPFAVDNVLATGPLLKNTFCLARDTYAFVSQHIGDMENLDTLAHYETALETYRRLFRLSPERVVCDLHPDYLTTRYAREFAQQHGLPAPVQVQHHQAHIASALADNGWSREAGPVIGVALDGTGYGTDGAIWGGEWFVGSYDGFRRAAHLEYLPLPGGDAAIRRPWRIAVAYLLTLLEPEDFPPGFCPSESVMIRRQIEHGLNVPWTSSMGRLFDAVSAWLDICNEAVYEAQAAIEMETVATRATEPAAAYPFDVVAVAGVDQIRLQPLFYAILDALDRGTPAPQVARNFHATVAAMITRVSERIRSRTGITTVALSGGVFQNRLLLQLAIPQLQRAGFRVLRHQQVPPNDGGISLGQVAMGSLVNSVEKD